jgi:hypothetical protein
MPLYNPAGAIPAGTTTGGALTVAGNLTATGGDVIIGTAGRGLQIKTGANSRAGTATLSSGTVTVSTSVITANSLIFLTDAASSVLGGMLSVTAKVVGTSFTVTSSLGATDNSPFNWLIIEGI